MTISIHTIATGTFVPALRDLSGVLRNGAAFAKEKGVDLVEARLAPDMFTLAQQVMIACVHAESAMLRLSGETPPAFDTPDASFDAFQARIARSIAAIEAVPAASLAGAEARSFEVQLVQGMVLPVNGLQLLLDWHFPHFHFHCVTAYDILRNAGVQLSKRDYLAHIGPMIRQTPA